MADAATNTEQAPSKNETATKTATAAIICNPVADVATNTADTSSISEANITYVTTDQLSQLKHDLLKEICAIERTEQEPLVSMLLKQIDFLQNTVKILIDKIGSNNQPPSHSQRPCPATRPAPCLAPRPTPRPRPQPVASVAATENQEVSPPLPEQTQLSPPAPSSSSTSAEPARRKYAKKQVLITGDSMLNSIDEKQMRRDAFVRVRNYPGATVEDLIDHTCAHIHHVQHDGVIMMAGHNDISINNYDENKNKAKRDTIAHYQSLIRQIKTKQQHLNMHTLQYAK